MVKRARRSRGLFAAGALLVVLAGAAAAYPLWWSNRAHAGGAALLSQARNLLVAEKSSGGKSCPTGAAASIQPAPDTAGIIEIPSLGLTAPVLNGVSEAVLDVAVGHVPATTWPGGSGESIIEAHDVSYFSGLSGVHTGDKIIWLTSCARMEFQVLGSRVQRPGDLIYSPPSGSGLALVTCYPTNALFWTTQRFVVTTQLVSSTFAHQNLPTSAAVVPDLTVPAPKALVDEGLGLDQNNLAMGVLQIVGTPAENFVKGPGPLSVEADALAVFFGAKKAVLAHNQTWWAALTLPGVPFRASWPSFGQANVTIYATGTKPTSIKISSGSSSVTIVNNANVLKISSVVG